MNPTDEQKIKEDVNNWKVRGWICVTRSPHADDALSVSIRLVFKQNQTDD